MADYGPKPTRTKLGSLAPAQSIVNTSGATTTFSNTFDANTGLIILEVQGASSYVTFDGTSASATNGHVLFLNQAYHWNVATAQAATFKAIGGSGRIMGSQFMILLDDTQLPDTSIIRTIPI